MTAGLYVNPEAPGFTPRGTLGFRFLWGGRDRTHAFGIEASYFGLGSFSSDRIGPVFRVGDSSPPDTVRIISRSSSSLIAFIPTYSLRPQGLGLPTSFFLSAGLALTHTRLVSRVEDLEGQVVFDETDTRTDLNFMARIGVAAAVPGILVDGAPEVGLHAYTVGTLLDISPLLGVYVGFRF